MNDLTLGALVAGSVQRHPDCTALETHGSKLSYHELWSAAGDAALKIDAANLGPPSAVGVLGDRSVESYIAYLAALRLGATVVPLNPLHPTARTTAVIAAAGIDVVVGSAAAVMTAGARDPGVTILALRPPEARPDVRLEPAGGDGEGFRCTNSEDIAYVLFTSGSTGQPKGVPVRHANVCGYVSDQASRYSAGPGARFSQTFDLTFDPSVFDLFVAWSSGAAVVVPTADQLREPVEFVQKRSITHWFSVPSVITLAKRMRKLGPDSMPSLRWSLFAGEQLTWGQVNAWARAASSSTVENLYGPTELTITATAYRVRADKASRPTTRNGTVPVGEPHRGFEYVLADDSGRLGDEGEFCARGPQRIKGYLDPVQNVGRFMIVRDEQAHPIEEAGPPGLDAYYRTGDRVYRSEEGDLVHLGRLDNQVKVHGYRVELGEIEAALRAHPTVEEAVVFREDDGSQELVAIYSGSPAPAGELTGFLGSVLPWYMIPVQLRWVETMPLNSNGKIDRAALYSRYGTSMSD